MKNIETPYISIQCLLREFAKALGTKSLAAKEIDNACKHTEINPHKLEELKTQLIHEPITKYVNVYFADHLMKQLEIVFSQYIEFVRKVPLDGVGALKGQELIHRHYITIATDFVCHEMFEGMRTTSEQVARMGKPAMQVAFDSFKDDSIWKQHIEQESKEQKDRYRSWLKDEKRELPDITSIGAMGEGLDSDLITNATWGVIKARLITARIWDYFFYHAGYCDLEIIGSLDLHQRFDLLTDSLYKLQREEGDKYRDSTPTALELLDRLQLRNAKSLRDKRRCIQLLDKLRSFQVKHDVNNETTYYYHWMNARYHLHSGDSDPALISYKLAYEQSVYRAGENIACIIKEAMLVAARAPTPDKAFLNKLRSMASILGIDILPTNPSDKTKTKPVLVEEWEIAAYARFFDSYFTEESFFPGAEYPTLHCQKVGPWMVDETKYQLNLKSPNKMFNVGEQGLLVKRMPQLVYFAMNDDIESVKQLLDTDVSVNKLSSSNESALLMAIQTIQVNLMPLNSMSDELFNLLSNKPHSEKSINAITSKRKLTALGCAVQTGRLDVVKKVVELGAEIDQRHDTVGESPLFTCIGLISRFKRPGLIQALSKQFQYHDDNLHAYMSNAAGMVPHDKQHLIQLMKNQANDPLHSSVIEAALELQQSNIEKYSTIDGYRDIAKYLISKGANPNAKHDTAYQGYTPMMLAAELDEGKLFQLMVEAGGDFNGSCVNTLNKQRVSCRDIALDWQSKSVLSIFTEESSSH
ncbi:ankyrin repeat domain-containing protein [Vibrio aestuarianus]|uniref:ankyrin repeat domain-containing protein n=1 Tax=Vibrio aestuarianus TaxID=28171 RepID=UPI00237CCD75|nr:ankyrin repeat domain-containing protein [Vibrio aestuarianus]MDE1211535.1 ankyrin repeat domain-containing protein [Vibrio aestuarianus]